MRPVAGLLLTILCLIPAYAGARVDERPALQRIHELPASAAEWPQTLSILSSLEWSAISPPGSPLLLIEDEPWLMLEGNYHKGLPYPGHGLSSQSLVSHSPNGGSFEAVASLRMSPCKGAANPLRRSFDASAASMVRRAQLFPEQRTAQGYVLTELRSPLGLSDPRDRENCGREYLGYQAELRNPLVDPPAEGEALYTRVNGELRVVRVVEGRHYLLTVEFTSQDYPWAISLTENIARLLLTQFVICDKAACIPEMLPYGREWYWPTDNFEQNSLLDMRAADLLERPDSGVVPPQDGRAVLLQAPPAVEPGIILPTPQFPDAPASRALPEAPRRSAVDMPELLTPFSGWLIDEPKPAPQPVPYEEAAAAEATPAQPAPRTDTAAIPVELPAAPPQEQPQPADASAAAPEIPKPAEAKPEPRLPKLFEGWGSPRSTAQPASRSLLDPFRGWLSDPPAKLVDRIAKQIQLRAERGR